MSKANTAEQYPFFVYGTLRPGAKRYLVVRAYVETFKSAVLNGYQMYDFGLFPGLVARQETVIPVQGDLLYIKPDQYEECVQRLDKYEAEGWLFSRVTEYAWPSGLSEPVFCWLYKVNEENMSVGEANLVRENDWFN